MIGSIKTALVGISVVSVASIFGYSMLAEKENIDNVQKGYDRHTEVVAAAASESGYDAGKHEEYNAGDAPSTPEQILSELDENEIIDLADSASAEAWKDKLDELGIQCESIDVCFHGDKVYSAYEVNVRTPSGEPGWIESRYAAFERAELLAKGQIISYLEQGIRTGSSLKEYEKFIVEVGDSQETLPPSQKDEIIDKVKVVLQKGLDFGESELDKRLKESDPSYDAKKYENMPPKKREALVKNQYKRDIVNFSERFLRGAVPVFSHESYKNSVGNVLVAVAWTPRSKRVAVSIGQGKYNATVMNPDNKKGPPVESKVPKEVDELMGAFGARLVINEKGEHVVLAFAQAEPRNSYSHDADAVKTAQKRSELRARALVARLVAEFIEVGRSEEGGESSAEFSDQSDWRENRSIFIEQVTSRTKSVRVQGLYPVKKWAAKHPLTDQIVVGSVLAWSPSSMEQAKDMQRIIQKSATKQSEVVGNKSKKHKADTYESKPINVEIDAY